LSQELYSTPEPCQLVGITDRTIRRWIAKRREPIFPPTDGSPATVDSDASPMLPEDCRESGSMVMGVEGGPRGLLNLSRLYPSQPAGGWKRFCLVSRI